VRRTEDCGRNAVGAELVVGPLALLRIIADEGNGRVVLIEDCDSPLQLRNDGVVSVETDLAGATQVLCDVAYEFAVKVEVAEAKVFPVAYQE
jgi:hypothetical protein